MVQFYGEDRKPIDVTPKCLTPIQVMELLAQRLPTAINVRILGEES